MPSHDPARPRFSKHKTHNYSILSYPKLERYIFTHRKDLPYPLAHKILLKRLTQQLANKEKLRTWGRIGGGRIAADNYRLRQEFWDSQGFQGFLALLAFPARPVLASALVLKLTTSLNYEVIVSVVIKKICPNPLVIPYKMYRDSTSSA